MTCASVVLLIAVAFVVGACASPSPTATGAPEPTPTAASMSTPVFATATPIPTATAPGRVLISVGKATFTADVADDDAKRIQGLSGRPSMADNQAMWFVYPSERVPAFWMIDMLFPLDIVWVNSALVVVDVTADAPIPPPGASPGDLPLYRPRAPAQYVLEINAGLAQQFGIVIGSHVTLSTP